MRSSAKQINRHSIKSDTGHAKEFEESLRHRLSQFDQDAQKPERTKRHWCRSCYYLAGRYGVTSICERPCGLCGTPVASGNSSTLPCLCVECGTRNGLCCRCGGDIEMKHQRKPRPYEQKGTANG